MKTNVFTLLLTVSITLFAESNESYDSKQIHLHALSPDVNLSAFEEKFTVHEYRYIHTNPHSELPDVHEAEKIFNMTGLTAVITELDQLERDMLFMKIRNHRTNESLIEDYPELTGHEEKLDRLRNIIEKPQDE